MDSRQLITPFMRRSHISPGFTLIEMLIVAPIIIIFIGVIIVMITAITGDTLQERERNNMAYQVQNALDMVETEGSRSATYPGTTGTLTSPQGLGNNTAAFTATGNDSTTNDVLIIKTPATDVNPVNSSRKLMYTNSPNACNSADVSKNPYYEIMTVYFISAKSLYQRTIMPSSGTACSTPWQRASCAESQPLTGVCKTYDNKLVDNVTSFSVQYLKEDGTATASSDPSVAKSVNLTITTNKQVAGKTITYTGTSRSVAMNGGALSDGGNNFMQTVTSANCPTTRTMKVDARDNRTYWVQKLADGKCWMLTNLAYAGGGTNTYNDTRSISNGESQSYSYTAPYYYVPSGANPTTNPTEPSTSTNGTGQYGYLYNWCAAMGVQTSTSACANATTPAPDTNTSICPAGWRLPTSNGGEFTALNNAVNSGSTSSDSGLIAAPWFAQRGGYWYSGFHYQGSYGHYWSSSQSSATGTFYLYFYSTNVTPSNASNKFYGFAVRCVAT